MTNGQLPKGYPREYRPRPVTYCIDCGYPHISLLDAKLCCLEKQVERRKREISDER